MLRLDDALFSNPTSRSGARDKIRSIEILKVKLPDSVELGRRVAEFVKETGKELVIDQASYYLARVLEKNSNQWDYQAVSRCVQR